MRAHVFFGISYTYVDVALIFRFCVSVRVFPPILFTPSLATTTNNRPTDHHLRTETGAHLAGAAARRIERARRRTANRPCGRTGMRAFTLSILYVL